ncbi:MAG TPA: ABC transporter ATP-binding protein [Deinococcales bacterium]|nr:ABC transporter ATP-binding protein [Deinococcales bacterium]
MAEQPFVVLDGIAKSWNGQVGVEEISLEIPEGAFVALLGPSGCGKSTTLRLLAGLETTDRGRIFIEGKDVTTAPPAERNLSMVFQSYALFPHLSVAENVIFGLRVRRVRRAERDRLLARALEITGLKGFETRKPGELSGGQRQRVALARAIVAEKKLCLMDEPLSNLDAKLRNSVRKDIKRLQRELGMTLLYVTHDQTEAMSMADTVVLMKDGLIKQAGTPEDLYSRPANTFTAEFIGSPPMSLIQAGAAGLQSSAHLVGIRAEHIRVVEEGAGRLDCTVTEAEFLGSETLLSLDHEAASGLAVTVPGLDLKPVGSRLGIDFSDSDAHFFDEGGDRIKTAANA